MQTSKLGLPFLFFTFIFALSPTAQAGPEACTQFYKSPVQKYALWLEEKSPEREAWIRRESGQTIQKLHDSKNYDVISDAVLSMNSSSRVLSIDQNGNAQYRLIFQGLNKPQSLVRVNGSKREEILTTKTIKDDGSFSLLKAHSTPKDTHVVVMATDNGNIDVFQMYVYDLTTKKVIAQLPTYETQITWKSEKEFYYIDASKRTSTEAKEEIKIYNLETGKTTLAKNQMISFVDKNSYVEYDKKNNSIHLKIAGRKDIALPKSHFNTEMNINALSVNAKNEVLISVANNWENVGKILKYSELNGKSRWDLLYQTGKNEVIEYVQFREHDIEIGIFWGASTVSKILDHSGKELFKVTAPECCQLARIDYKEGQDIVDITLSSQFKSNVSFKYSIKENRFLDPTLTNKMMSFDGQDYTSAIHWANSQDGTKIPVRLTYRRNLKRDGQNPLLIYGYGGFMISGYTNSVDSTMNTFFIKNGGILAGPALRGGNEFGKPWHEAAMFQKKYKTMEDFAATALLVHDIQLSSPAITAIQGWSNGGFTTAATGLRFPNIIGIVVSGNGVNDQHRKEVLDPHFGKGWSYEYGDSRIPFIGNYLQNWSPVYIGQLPRPTPKILVMNGRADSRVNSAHSFKLVHALKTQSTTPENINLISVPNSGHWVTSVAYQNTIAWKAQTLIWTYLFDQMGMTARF
ncbi:MAG: prolyl oligopeptidase family serine peptidase [Bdellovibrionaceae bacterium]|nr:prolyl oligopeptidase family serine peptidase [Pseudobdellovibrionaceae bacterium]